MAMKKAHALALLLCVVLSGVTSGLAQGKSNGRGWGAAGGKGKGGGGGGKGKGAAAGKGYGGVGGGKGKGFGAAGGKANGGQGPPWANLIYNTTLLANLTDASQVKIGGVELSLFLNTNTSDYDLSYHLRVQVPAGDSPTSAAVLLGTDSILTLSPNGFVTRGNNSFVAGTFKALSSLQASNGQTYLDVIKAMIASPVSYTAQVASANAPTGLASGSFGNKTLTGLKNRGGDGRYGQEGHGQGDH